MALPVTPTATIYAFITGDFESAWNAIAAFPSDTEDARSLQNRGNFYFGMQAMVFLEWICRLCKSDPTGQAMQDFSRELHAVEPRYFTQIAGSCQLPPCPPRGFHLPSVGGTPCERLLLSTLFDLLRNGLAHRYEQIVVTLINGELGVSLYGPEYEHLLRTVTRFRASHHLSYQTIDGNIIIRAHPGILFLDFKAAFENAKLAQPARNLTSDRFQRGGMGRPDYQFSSGDLEAALRDAGHIVTP